MTELRVLRWWSSWGWERERWEENGQIIMRNWNLREFCAQVNWPSPIWQVRVPIQRVITKIRSLPNPIRQVVPLLSHIRSYPPHCSHRYPPSLSFSSTTLPSSQITKLNHPSLSLHAMIMSWHWVQAYTKYKHTPSTSIHQVQAYTKYSIHRVQHPPTIVCLPFILMITCWPLNVASGSGVHPYTIDRHQWTLHRSSKVKSDCHTPTVPS